MQSIFISATLIASLAATALPAQEATPANGAPRHNVILFVADGLRGGIVDAGSAPTIARLRDEGVAFPNSHSVFPTFTTANASVLATGHQLGDTGDFSNTIYTGKPIASAGGSVTPFLENDLVLGKVDAEFGGDYLNEETVLAVARRAGFGTAAIGKLGPALIQDHHARDGEGTIVIDDSTGTAAGVPLAANVAAALVSGGLPTTTPGRGPNGRSGSATEPGTMAANIQQQDYFLAAATRVVLPMLQQGGSPFAMVFWSRDPDGTQHNQGDSLNRLTPGINGPTTFAAIRNADRDLAELRATLDRLGLAATTDIIVTSDHGFSTIAKSSRTSSAAQRRYLDVPGGLLPPGFLALDLAAALDFKMFDPESADRPIAAGQHPSRGNALLGDDPSQPRIVVAANGGSDLLYLPTRDRRLARRVVTALLRQDYVDGLFVDDAFGRIPGTLPMSAINLIGRAVTPRPSIVVAFKTWSTGCAVPTNCQAEIADTTLQQGQGMHGSFGRGDTFSFTAATGPNFKHGFTDPAPISNVDVGRTMAALLGLRVPSKGTLTGRVLTEAMPGGAVPRARRQVATSARARDGSRMVMTYQTIGCVRYLYAARREMRP